MTTSTTHEQLLEHLRELESELQVQRLWGTAAPSAQAMASQLPFMYDTLQLHEWLQWVFLPRLRALIEARGSLAFPCNIHPLAEHEWLERQDFDKQHLLTLLSRIDRVLNNGNLTPEAEAAEAKNLH